MPYGYANTEGVWAFLSWSYTFKTILHILPPSLHNADGQISQCVYCILALWTVKMLEECQHKTRWRHWNSQQYSLWLLLFCKSTTVGRGAAEIATHRVYFLQFIRNQANFTVYEQLNCLKVFFFSCSYLTTRENLHRYILLGLKKK